MCPGVCGSNFELSQVAAVKFCYFRFIWSLKSAKRIYAEVVSGIENTPDDDQSRMRAYQQESEEDALKKSHQIKEGIHDFHNGGHRESPGSSCMKNEVRKAKLSRRVPLRLLWRVLRIFQSRHFLRKTIYQALLFLEQTWGVKNLTD